MKICRQGNHFSCKTVYINVGSLKITIVSVVSVLSDMQSAIKVATGKLGLQPGAAFQARVAQLAELVKAHKLVSFISVKISISFPSLALWTKNASKVLSLESHVP